MSLEDVIDTDFRSVAFKQIGGSKYLWSAKYIIKDFDKYSKVENSENSNNENKIVSFFSARIGKSLILFYHISGSNRSYIFKKFDIETSEDSNDVTIANLFETSNNLEKFLIKFLDENCVGIEKELTKNQIDYLDTEISDTIDSKKNLEKALEEKYEISSLS